MSKEVYSYGDKKMEIVKLKNGAEEADIAVKVTMMSLNMLMETNPIAAYELVQICKNPNHKMFGNTEEVLVDLSLLSEDGVHSVIKNVVMSAFEGEGLDMCLTSPLA